MSANDDQKLHHYGHMVPRTVALLGMVGHGKTRLLNTLTGVHFPSNAGAESCTRTLQHGKLRRTGQQQQPEVFVIDTPGIGSSEDIAAHVGAQKLALEGMLLSGVYAVVKCGRADDIVRVVESIMDFVGQDDIRVFITHADVALHQEAFDAERLKERVAASLDIAVANICLAGLDTSWQEMQDFVVGTLHDPVQLVIQDTQIAALTKLSSVSRKFNKPIKAILAKIEVATKTCERLVQQQGGKTHETDVLIIQTQTAISEDVKQTKERIFRDAFDLPSMDAQNLVYGKAGVSLSVALRTHIQTTNRFLTWDVTDPNDKRNQYRKCPHCDAVYIKVSGCDHVSCGADLPAQDAVTTYDALRIWFREVGTTWKVCFGVNGVEIDERDIRSRLRASARRYTSAYTGQGNYQERLDQAKRRRTRELNVFCGRKLNWSEMLPLTESELAPLGNVELAPKGALEDLSSRNFAQRMSHYEEENKKNLPTRAWNWIFGSKKP